MATQIERAESFAKLHIKGNPIIIFNAWDGGSARAIADAGAKAIATGDHPVGFAHGFTNDDFHDFTFDIYLATIKEIAGRIGDLPYSVDISNGGGLDEQGLVDRVTQLLELGVVGVNFEDTTDDETTLRPIEEQAARIRAIRSAADTFGVPLFINARSDVFVKTEANDDQLDQAVERAKAYQTAGASGFFAPGLFDLDNIRTLTGATDLPVNIIRLPGAPSTADLREAGVSRISYGPVPQMRMTEWLKEQAASALAGKE